MLKSHELTELRAAVQGDILERFGTGRVADDIPALARVDPRRFGLAVVTCTGESASVGDSGVPFSIQSVSKVFTLTLDRLGDALWQHVGREASGSPFNSIVQLERELGNPRSPLINADAIVVLRAVLLIWHQIF